MSTCLNENSFFSLTSADAPLWAPVVLNGLSPEPSPACLPYVGLIDERCVRLEAALHRMITVWHQSTTRAIKEQMDTNQSNAFVSLSRYSDVTQWTFCAALLQVEYTWCHHWWLIDITMLRRHRDPPKPPPLYPPQSVTCQYRVRKENEVFIESA